MEQMSKETLDAIMNAKQLVSNLLNSLKQIAKKTKQTKKSRKAMKLMDEFIRCNITSPAIFLKYQRIVDLLQEYTGVNKE